MKTLKIEPTNRADQGDFVEIDAANYNPAIHTLIEGEVSPVALSVGMSAFGPAEGESNVAYAVRLMSAAYDFNASLSVEEQDEFHTLMRAEAIRRGIFAEPGVNEALPAADEPPKADEPPAPKETKHQKAARLAAEAAAAAAEDTGDETPSVDPAPAPAPAWDTPAAT
jgi:hypothetical protein